jgi:hypothetical protein
MDTHYLDRAWTSPIYDLCSRSAEAFAGTGMILNYDTFYPVFGVYDFESGRVTQFTEATRRLFEPQQLRFAQESRRSKT